jgi:hypothetical protein
MCARAQIRRLEDMIFLIHLLQDLGIPSGVAIAVIIAGRKMLGGGTAKNRNRRDGGRDRRRSRAYR